jgi:hypothetical protein
VGSRASSLVRRRTGRSRATNNLCVAKTAGFSHARMHGWHVHARIVIGQRSCVVRRAVLTRDQAALVLQIPATDVRNLQRRGRRFQLQGLNDHEIVSRGALPPVIGGGRGWGVAPSVLAQHPTVDRRPLALGVLADLVEGRITAPLQDVNRRPPPLVSLA